MGGSGALGWDNVVLKSFLGFCIVEQLGGRADPSVGRNGV